MSRDGGLPSPLCNPLPKGTVKKPTQTATRAGVLPPSQVPSLEQDARHSSLCAMSDLATLAKSMLAEAKTAPKASPKSQQPRRLHTELEPVMEELLKKGHTVSDITTWILQRLNADPPKPKSPVWNAMYGRVRRCATRLQSGKT
jgi:hypothetical protein